MVLYECKFCNFNSKIKTHYTRHLNTKKHGHNSNPKYNFEEELLLMNQNEPIMNQNEPAMNQNEPAMNHCEKKKVKKFSCYHCEEKFYTHPSKRRHELHRCKHNPDIIELLFKEKNKQIIKIKKEKEKLEKKVDKLTDKIGNTTNIQNNIKINSYGNEDISHITDAFKTSLLNGPYGAIPKMIKAIHFNDNKPENKNVIMPNLNKNILKVKNDDKWVHKNKDMILFDMIDSKYLMLDEHYDLIINGQNISKYIKTNYAKFRAKYDEGDKELISDLKNDCELVIMDNRE
jgi:hypothetical protein